jgi:hypothetical protein
MEYPRFTGTEPCTEIGGELFFPDDTLRKQVNKHVMRNVCAGCDMLMECREYALHHQVSGFWGGMSGQERRQERRRRNIIAIPIVESA